MGRWPDRSNRALSAACTLLVLASAMALGPVGYTSGLFTDRTQATNHVSAAPGSISVTPGVYDVGLLHVGDKCTDVELARITTTWPISLSVSVEGGWLTDSDVQVSPASIGPGETATVYFTNAAVNGPQAIDDVITVHGDPGGVVKTLRVTGAVVNPADPATHDPDPLPPGCVHPAGKKSTAPVSADCIPLVPEATAAAPPDCSAPAPETAPAPTAPAPETAPVPTAPAPETAPVPEQSSAPQEGG
ncbi:MAG TPA: hypothetical protein VNT01_02100 [Symbiobacteriaceae bacterium]|nr:hypothetical protein [Symbiobacteriaceae bacterium]